jgi:alpha-L-rhamnosidase
MAALQELSMNNGYATIANVPLPAALDPGTLHTVKTVVAGTTVTTFLDGQQIASFDSSKFASGIPVYTSGTFGIREYAGEEAEFNNLTITDPQGNVLFQNSLSTTAALNDFSVPAGGDPLSLIMDGAKRDRVVWSGDINVEGPTLYYSTAANEYIQQSMLLLGSYQEATGEAGSDVPPTAPLEPFRVAATPIRHPTRSISFLIWLTIICIPGTNPLWKKNGRSFSGNWLTML